MRRVLATAGHVDHGKSTLVRALTGRDPDRLAEERERGLTIELGFAWTRLGDDVDLAIVDVPGHRRFIGTMLTGLGPAPAVLLVVAADQGWQAQTSEHVGAVAALGIRDVLLAVTRSDLADPEPVRAEALARLAELGWPDVPSIVVSATTGLGVEDLRTALTTLVTALPEPDPAAPVRLWVDRSFTIGGAGTVVTGTLGHGTLSVGDHLEVHDPGTGRHAVTVRGLHSEDTRHESLTGITRAAVNLRRVDVGAVGRGAVVVTPDAFVLSRTVDVAVESADLPEQLTVHVGTADHEGVVRPLGPAHARVRIETALPWRVGDRLVLRDPGSRRTWGAQVRDVDTLPLRRRGAAVARGEALSTTDPRALRLTERRVQRADHLGRLGLGTARADEVHVGDHVVDPAAWAGWRAEAPRLVDALRDRDPLSAGLPVAELAHLLRLPADADTLVAAVAAAAGLEVTEGRVHRAGPAGLGPAEAGVAEVERRLRESPFAAPERDDLAALGLGARELAAAARLGRLLRLPDDVVLLPDGPARAMRELAGLGGPFTLSEARQALGTTRRVAVPLLEHLDAKGWTRRLDSRLREVAR